MTRRALTGWGRTAPSVATVERVGSPDEVTRAIAALASGRDGAGAAPPGSRPRSLVARGLGRSYGDAAQSGGGLVLDMTGLHELHAVDETTGLVDVDAGASLATLIAGLLPRGLWVPVLPGTRNVTVGGAVAADVHGKNHHVDGSFGDHVLSLDLALADGSVRTVRPDSEAAGDRQLFRATVGGMGLTGIILRARFRCHRVETSSVVVDTERAVDLDDLLGRLAAHDGSRYSVAWFDAVSGGSRLGRAVISRGRHATVEDLQPRARATPLAHRTPARGTVPEAVPAGLLNRASARAFNELYFRAAPRTRRGEVKGMTGFFHPLDAIGAWNRLYGPGGLVQYQLVVPDGEEDALRAAVHLIATSVHVSCLNVLKRFGPGNGFPLSFPLRGWTLAVDLPVRSGLGRLLRDLDELVVAAGGRIYLAKDSRATAGTLAAMYPGLPELRETRRRVDPDGVFASDLSRRMEL